MKVRRVRKGRKVVARMVMAEVGNECDLLLGEGEGPIERCIVGYVILSTLVFL